MLTKLNSAWVLTHVDETRQYRGRTYVDETQNYNGLTHVDETQFSMGFDLC